MAHSEPPQTGEIPDDLKAEQLTELHGDLLAIRDELEDSLALSRDSAQTVDLDQPIGRLSRMDALQQQSMVKAQRDRFEQRRGQVLAALRSFERDEYGECRRCNEPIGYRRLKVRPEAPFCVACREELEKKG